MRRLAAVVAVMAVLAGLGQIWAVPAPPIQIPDPDDEGGPGMRIRPVMEGDDGAVAGADVPARPADPDVEEAVVRKDYPEIAPAVPAAGKGDVVLTRSGSRIVGKVISLDPKGVVRLGSPEFDGEVRVSAAAVGKVLLKQTEAESGTHVIDTVGGDRLVGDLKAVTSQGIVLETRATGTVTVPTAAARSLRLAKGGDVLIETDFLRGEIGPWKTRTPPGMWTLEESGLRFHSSVELLGSDASPEGQSTPIYAPLDQKEPITIVARIGKRGGSGSKPPSDDDGMSVILALFCDSAGPYKDSDEGDPANTYGHSSLYVVFANTECYINSVLNGNQQNETHELEQPNRGSLMRVAYDPETAKVRLWADDRELGKFGVPVKLPPGKFVMLDATDSTPIEYVRVMRGIVPPGDDDVEPAGTEGKGEKAPPVTVYFVNKDRLSATSVRTDGEQFVITAEGGEIRTPRTTVSRLRFSAKAPAAQPQPAARYVQVETGACRLTLRLDRLDADGLVGQSDYLGEVKLRRDAVRQIQFVADPKAETPATEAPSADRGAKELRQWIKQLWETAKGAGAPLGPPVK